MWKRATLGRFPKEGVLRGLSLFRLRRRALRIGRRGEDAAGRFLENAGYALLCRNWRAPHNLGELDLVCRDGAGVLCFVEVKTRRIKQTNAAVAFGESIPSPLAALTRGKRRRMARAAAEYLSALGNPQVPIRYDVVEVWSESSGHPRFLRHWPAVSVKTRRRFPERAWADGRFRNAIPA